MSGRLRELAKREGLSFEVARLTLSRLVVEALDDQERRQNEKVAEPAEVLPVGADIVAIDEQREKRAGRHRLRCESCRGRFTANRRHARFCSVACRVRAYRKRTVA